MNGWEETSEQDVINKMEDLGYVFLSKSHLDSPGYTGLIVAIRETPTNQHYDPESIRLQINDKDGSASWVTIRYSSLTAGSMHLCPGQVTLTDRGGKQVAFFTFGGQLEATTNSGERIYFLHSPAPILGVLDNQESFPDQLAFEVEALLAELHARWGIDDRGFARQLGQIDPFRLYLTSLHTILSRYQRNRNLRQGWHGFYTNLLQEQEWLMQTGRWLIPPLSLEDLPIPDHKANHR